jgi:alanyl-tRNA synthetase
MAQHTGQHALSAALLQAARAETASSRLGESACTIDVDRESLAEREVARAEELANAVIDDDVAIRAFFPSAEELAALPLRRRPKVSENVRVVEIAGFDVSPCGGTHCTSSAQIGLLRVTALERYKGKMRVTFAAGRRAREALASQADTLAELSRELTCGPAAVPAALAKLRRELGEAREAQGALRTQLADSTARALCAEGSTRVVAVFDGGDVEFLRAVAARVTDGGERVALLAARGLEGLAVVIARGPQSGFDCGAFLKRAAAASGGRGGGRAERAEGRLPPGADWTALVAAHAG